MENEIEKFNAAKSRWIHVRAELDPPVAETHLATICSLCDAALGNFFRQAGWPSNGAMSNYGRVFGFDEILRVSHTYGMADQGFLAIGDGPDGDYIAVNLQSHLVGWLPFGSVFPETDIQSLFVPVECSIATHFWKGEFDWANVAKDHCSAKKCSLI